jgi:quinol-cytochrome oxidoreductase complex cytochrome b subunit/mono/diheme cytochrome c family protein
MYGGWLLRGIHHYTAQVMIVLLALHMLQVIVDGAYRAPREVNFWIGLVLLNLVLFLSLTGYLLPWDQKGYWATKVATSLMAVVPGIGTYLQRVVVGGPEYGHHTLTRFFALHAGLLPFLMMLFIAAHVYVFRRHGLHYKQPRARADSYFWPDQVLRDAVACLGVLLVVLLLCLRFGFSEGGFHDVGKLGADLAAPADPAEPYGAARPEWYFLFLFQFLKLPYFAGHGEIYGAVVIPGVIMGLLFLMPISGRWKVGHWFNVLLTVFLATGVILLTTMALVEDAGRPSVRLPPLNRLDIRFAVVWTGMLVVLVLALVPTIGSEASSRLNRYVLGALIVGVVIALAVAAAGGGTQRRTASATTAPSSAPATAPVLAEGVPLPTPPPALALGEITQSERVYRVLLLALLGGLVLLITIALLKSPSRTTRRLGTHTDAAAHPEVTAAADAELPAAVAAYSRGSDGTDADGPIDSAWLRRWQLHHRLRLALLLVVLGGAVLLMAISVVGGGQNDDKRVAYRAAVQSAHRDAERVVSLASSAGGIPPQGAVWLLRNDPATQGPRLFARNCASCHRFDGHDGLGRPVTDPQSAPDLAGFASNDWITGLLNPDLVDTPKYFGPNMKAHNGKMVDFVKDEVAGATAEEKKELATIVVALSAEADLPRDRDLMGLLAPGIESGRKAIKESVLECTQCHAFRGEKPSLGGASRGPDLTGYGSRQWLIDFIKNPQHPRFYPGNKNDRMPLYGEQKILDERSIALIVDWIRGDVDGASGSAEPVAEQVPATIPVTAPSSAPTTSPAATKPAELTPRAPAPSPPKPPDKPREEPAFETEFETPPRS